MKKLSGIILTASMVFLTQATQAYETKKYGTESSSTIYKITCSSGKTHLVRNENNGKWCSGSTCYNSLDALMRRAFSNCK